MPTRQRTVAILGATSGIGRLLTTRLLAERHTTVLALDAATPTDLPSGVTGMALDLAAAGAAQALAAVIDAEDVDTVVHLGALTGRRDQQECQASEVQQIGRALELRPVLRVIFSSSTTVYGALPGDPTYSDEDTAFAESPRSNWVRDKVLAERRIADLSLNIDAAVTVLRFAMVLGQHAPNFITEYLARKAVPVIIDQDPSMQFIHETDVVGALVHAVRRGADGAYNIVGEGAVPLSVALRAGRRRSAPVPELGSYPLHHALWDPEVVRAPDVLHDLFKYVWVADATRAHEEFGFQTHMSSKEAVEDFYRRLV